MVSRIQNRNTGYSENLFSQSQRTENNTFGSIEGATALKLDESYLLDEQEQNNSLNQIEDQLDNEEIINSQINNKQSQNNFSSGVSIESASYIENNNLDENEIATSHNNNVEEYTPKLFSEDEGFQSDETSSERVEEEINDTEQLFDQDNNEEEDFEIPAFLRKQKF